MDEEIASLSEKFGTPQLITERLPCGDTDPLSSQRQGEVAMVLLRKSNKILLNTKGFYPSGTFRIPTGGIKKGEPVEAALLRETMEETNLEVEVLRFLAVITYQVPGRPAPFTTYAFLLREIAGELKVNDPKERISGWLEVEAGCLKEVGERLANLEGDWKGWGGFRSVVHRIVGDLLTS